MSDLITFETTVFSHLNGYPAGDDTEIGLIEADLELIKDKLANYVPSDSTIDKIYNKLDTKAGEEALDKIVEIITAIKLANEAQNLTTEDELYKLLQAAFEDFYYEVSIEDEICVTVKFELPSYAVGLDEDRLASLLE